MIRWKHRMPPNGSDESLDSVLDNVNRCIYRPMHTNDTFNGGE